ncbi:hypothetical protein GCM10010191_33280 [Actinomadura vinacea]|uniref:CHRD domain-containing protein n=1 Tax=Actinomadura vinacea TaxID=115336 RepID=A0ABN3J135_9ACTN
MSVRTFVLPAVAAAALVATGAGVGVAALTDVLGTSAGAATGKAGSGQGHGAHGGAGAPAALPVDKPAGGQAQGAGKGGKGDITYLAASLLGRNEVPAANGQAVGDRDGRAWALVRIQGDRLWYAIRWQDVAAPTAGHIHLGPAGANGAIKVPFFMGTLPGTARAVAGTVQVTDKAVLAQLKANPNGFYANLHTGEFPGGAVRGQFHKLNRPADLNGVLNGSSPATLQSISDGAQEVPAKDGKATGDPDGRAAAFARSHDGMLSWGLTWSAVAPPTIGHVHQGAKGANGPVVADLFSAPGGLPATVTGLAGMSPVRADVARRIMTAPGGFYTNLHTAEFPGGAVRGQLAPAAGQSPRAFARPVLQGAQIYRCTRQADGTYAFTQDGVAATLTGGIAHSFAKPGPAGPPQWIAPDRSAVTGKAVTKTPNGDGNIPELVLDATQTGARNGLFSGTTQILRLNTIGGVAPAGACDPNTRPLARVPYRADYLFLD